MIKSIAFSGKGGVGKTTTLILSLKALIEKDNNYRILVIDADPDANIADQIGISIDFKDTIAGKMHSIMHKIELKNIAPYTSNKQAIESELFNSMVHMENFDLVEMGRMEGEGCYCSVNNVLKNTLDILSETYDYVFFDSPAGLEHFARKTAKDVSDLVIIIDPSKLAFHTLKRILVIAEELSLDFENFWVIGNRFSHETEDFMCQKLEKFNNDKIKVLGFMPEDTELMKYNLLNQNLLKLPSSNVAYKKVKELFEKVL